MSPSPFPLPHYILAGGRSQRFGSDKARHPIDGTPMLVRVARAFAPLARHTTVVAHAVDAYADLGVVTIADPTPHAGPLAGLVTAFRHHADQSRPSPWILLTSCDLLHPDPAGLAPLAAALSPHHLAAVYRADRFAEPFPGLYHRRCADAATHALRSSRPSFQAFFQGLGPELCPVTTTTARHPPFHDMDHPPEPAAPAPPTDRPREDPH
ncbi:MAG: molybdenum cofactor guanylyltransferase [Planctomycetota bacterium]